MASSRAWPTPPRAEGRKKGLASGLAAQGQGGGQVRAGAQMQKEGQRQMGHARIRLPYRVPHFLWVFSATASGYLLCTFCAPVCSVLGRLRTCQRSGTSGGVRPPAGRTPKCSCSVLEEGRTRRDRHGQRHIREAARIRHPTADGLGLAARYDKWAPILYLTVQAIKGISPRNVLDGYTYSLVLPPPRCLELHRRRRRPPVSRLRTSTSGVGTRE